METHLVGILSSSFVLQNLFFCWLDTYVHFRYISDFHCVCVSGPGMSAIITRISYLVFSHNLVNIAKYRLHIVRTFQQIIAQGCSGPLQSVRGARNVICFLKAMTNSKCIFLKCTWPTLCKFISNLFRFLLFLSNLFLCKLLFAWSSVKHCCLMR